jgi:hypothetical protein
VKGGNIRRIDEPVPVKPVSEPVPFGTAFQRRKVWGLHKTGRSLRDL